MDGLALWIASEAITNSEEHAGVNFGLISRQADPTDDKALVHSIENKLATIAGDDLRGVWLASSWGNDVPQSATLTLIGSEAVPLASFVDQALSELAGSLRLQGSFVDQKTTILKAWNTVIDEPMLHHALRKAIQEREAPSAAKAPNSTHRPTPPPGSISIDEMLAQAKAKFTRLTASEAHTRFTENQSQTAPSPLSVLIDIRPEAQRLQEGRIPGAIIIERNVLEWRLDPQSDARLPEPQGIAERYDNQIIVFCSEGYTSSLAAASLLALGLHNTTDIDGGFKAWKAASLPVTGGSSA